MIFKRAKRKFLKQETEKSCTIFFFAACHEFCEYIKFNREIQNIVKFCNLIYFFGQLIHKF